jgi:heparan-alpha-glucosaminide N-acetyltransferase
MLIASVTSNSLVPVPDWYDHSRWDGVHGIDLIFPVFVTITGIGLGFAMHRRVGPRPLLRRAAVLFVAGLLYNAVTLWSVDPGTWRVPGVLQMYACVVLVLGLLHLLTRTWVGWAVITLSLAAAHSVLLAVTAVHCPGGILTRECNPSGVLDSMLFGAAHIYQQGAAGHDPEGAVAVLGALVSASAGATAAHLLLAVRARADQADRVGRVTAAIVPMVALAAALGAAAWLAVQVPDWATGTPMLVMKRLWTVPFGLGVAAVTVVALLLVHLLLDRPSSGPLVRVGSYPLRALGRNSLLVYFGSHVAMSLLARSFGGEPSAVERLWPVLGVAGHPQLTWSIVLVLGWTAVAVFLHHRKIYLRP